MATIFYWLSTGEIYGVHPDNNIAVPVGVGRLEVAALTPDKISWPIPPGKQTGGEHTSVVDVSGPVPALKVKLAVPATPKEELRATIEELLGSASISTSQMQNFLRKLKETV